jgi:tetrahydromethanopterin S-methyltransferase subunit G
LGNILKFHNNLLLSWFDYDIVVFQPLTRTTYLVVTSDREVKREIKAIETPLQKVLKLEGVSYKMKSNPTNKSINTFNDKLDFGFIAQDVEKVIPEVVGKDANGVYGINYLMIIPVLTESIKELSDQNSELQKKVDALESQIEYIKSHVQQCCNQKEGFPDMNQSKQNRLFQNIPNPFKGTTTFSYELKNISKVVSLKIFSLNGDLLQTLSQNNSDEGVFEFRAGNLKSGTYLAVLMVDGQTVDTKYFSLLKD